MSFVAVAIGASAVTGVVGSVISANANSEAADKAAAGAAASAAAQLEYNKQAIATLQGGAAGSLESIQTAMQKAQQDAQYFYVQARDVAAIRGDQAAAQYLAAGQQAMAEYKKYADQATGILQQSAQQAQATAAAYSAQAVQVAQQYGEQAAATIKAEAAKAAGIAAQYTEQARGIIEQHTQEANKILEGVKAENAGGTTYLRDVMGGSADLTPEQQAQLDRVRLSTGNHIRSSSLAGSGRAAAALMRSTENDFTNTALAQNRARADSAAGTLAGREYGAGSGMAQNTMTSGTAQGNIVSAGGNTQANIIGNAGNAAGNVLNSVGQTSSNILQNAGNTQANILTNSGNAQAGVATGVGNNASQNIIGTNLAAGQANVAAGNTISNAAMQTGGILANSWMSAGQQAANTQNTLGVNTANIISGSGKAVGGSLADAAMYDANATTANGKVYGQALGSIGSAINSAARDSRYSGLRTSGVSGGAGNADTIDFSGLS